MIQPPTDRPVVSVIIANYNGSLYLEQAVRSALGQTVKNIEVLIADDLSSDESPAIGRFLAAQDARVRFLPAGRNGGPAAARNRALGEARGEWLAILDNDDMMHPSRLEYLLEVAERLSADIVADDLLVFSDTFDGDTAGFLTTPENHEEFEITPLRYFEQSVMYGGKPNLGFLKPVIRRAALDKAGLRYDESLRIAEDDDLIIRALAKGMRYWVSPRLTYFYRKHQRSISHRTTTADLDAMARASQAIHARFPLADRATRQAIQRRVGATRDALIFQKAIDALKQRKIGAALALFLKCPSSVRLLRLPIVARLSRHIAPAPSAEPKTGRNVLIVSRQRIIGRDNGSSAYLLDIADALRAAGMTPHLLQPAPSVMGRRPVIRLRPDLDAFASHRVRGVVKAGRLIISLDWQVWRDAVLGTCARLAKAVGLRLNLPDTPYPHAIAMPWSEKDRLFVARYGRSKADAVLIDYVFQGEAVPMLLRPEAPSAIILHDLYAQRTASFGDDASRDSVTDLDSEREIALMRQADAVIAIQPQEADWVRRHVPSVHVLTAPMAAHPVALAQPGNDRDVLFVGSIAPPNVMALEWTFAEIWPRVRERRPDARLFIAGSVADRFAGSAMQHRRSGIEFLGVVRDLTPLYREVGVVISPLTAGSGLKIKLIDALAQGKAVVATSVTLQGVEAEAGPAVWQADDAAGFADGIVSLLGDLALRMRRADRALDVARTAFSPEQSYGPLIHWLDENLAQRKDCDIAKGQAMERREPGAATTRFPFRPRNMNRDADEILHMKRYSPVTSIWPWL
ncbi:MAG: glycosyltransferase [Sphingomonadales bacterium]|nr:glycosyltransferase [Sphingomonadales bacterium]MDE2170443.1 glycosyltransferase [Sphingomonadales bacterium]